MREPVGLSNFTPTSLTCRKVATFVASKPARKGLFYDTHLHSLTLWEPVRTGFGAKGKVPFQEQPSVQTFLYKCLDPERMNSLKCPAKGWQPETSPILQPPQERLGSPFPLVRQVHLQGPFGSLAFGRAGRPAWEWVK